MMAECPRCPGAECRCHQPVPGPVGTESGLRERLLDLLAGSTEVVPYEHGDDVTVYCGKACGPVVGHVRVLNHNDPTKRLMVHCSTRGCSGTGHSDVARLPKRYRVSREQLAAEAVSALPELLAAALPAPVGEGDGLEDLLAAHDTFIAHGGLGSDDWQCICGFTFTCPGPKVRGEAVHRRHVAAQIRAGWHR